MLPHFVVTRLGIGIHSESWYESAIPLFEAVTFASLEAQTSQDFTSLIIVDHEMPMSARAHLTRIVDGRRNFHIVPIDLTRMSQVRQGCFDYVWDCCQDYLLQHGLITDPFAYVITSVLDGDDAWHRETVAAVGAQLSSQVPRFLLEEKSRPTWIRHTCGMSLTYVHGLQWFAREDVVEQLYHQCHSMSVFLVARFSAGISACSSRHAKWPSYCDVLAFDFKEVSSPAHPKWVYVRHDRSEIGWDAQGRKTDHPSSVERLHADFGIDFDKVAQWRSTMRPSGTSRSGVPANHAGMIGTEQLDCYFRITALNRQIECLERGAAGAGHDAGRQPLLASQRAKREELLSVYRRQALSLFR